MDNAPTRRWDDPALGERFRSIDRELEELRTMRNEVSRAHGRIDRLGDNVAALREDFREFLAEYRQDRDRRSTGRTARWTAALAAFAVVLAALITAIAAILSGGGPS